MVEVKFFFKCGRNTACGTYLTQLKGLAKHNVSGSITLPRFIGTHVGDGNVSFACGFPKPHRLQRDVSFSITSGLTNEPMRHERGCFFQCGVVSKNVKKGVSFWQVRHRGQCEHKVNLLLSSQLPPVVNKR